MVEKNLSCGSIERDFEFWVPMGIVKSEKEEMRIGGIATDENTEDLQGETVLLRGLDVSYLQKRGTWNWDHQKDPGSILGEVDIVQKNVDDGTLYVEGTLYPQVEKAIEVYNLMKGMEKSGSNRKLGMSLEGKVKERDGTNGKIIKSAWIKNIALTYHPINQNTFVDFIKSLGDKPIYEPCNCECGTDACPFSKAMCAGYDAAATSGGVSGSAVKNESLEKDEKVTTYTEDDLKKKKKKENGEITKSYLEGILMEKGYSESLANRMSGLLFNAAKAKKTLTKSDVISLLKDKKGYSDEAATRMTDILFSLVKGNVYIPDHYRTINGERKLIKGFNQTRQLKDLDKAEKYRGHKAYQRRSKSGTLSQIKQAGIVGEPYRTKGSKNKKPEEAEKAPEKVEVKEKGEKDTKFWETWGKQYSDPEMQKYLNEEGKKKLAELTASKEDHYENLKKEHGESVAEHYKMLKEEHGVSHEKALASAKGMGELIGTLKDKDKEAKKEKKAKQPGVAEVEKIHKEGAKADKAHKEAPKEEPKEAPKEEPVSMEVKGEGKPPEKKVEAGTKEAEWEVSESKSGTLHAKEFYSSAGRLMSDKYHGIAQNYPSTTPEESQRMIDVLKYGLSQYKEMYVEKINWGEKAADQNWLQTNKLVGAEEGKRRGLMKRADGYPSGSKDQRQWFHASLQIQEKIPKIVLNQYAATGSTGGAKD
jgi:hypothetical protein